MYLQGVADFLDDLLGGVGLVGYGLVVGSLLWSAAVLEETLLRLHAGRPLQDAGDFSPGA
jgi:hypothetical protein